MMRTRPLPIPLLGAIAVTRAILGAGIGLLASSRLRRRRRRALGLALVGFGVATTLPIALRVFARR
jgi:hypothetical protein